MQPNEKCASCGFRSSLSLAIRRGDAANPLITSPMSDFCYLRGSPVMREDARGCGEWVCKSLIDYSAKPAEEGPLSWLRASQIRIRAQAA
jgi:hypothetical protein